MVDEYHLCGEIIFRFLLVGIILIAVFFISKDMLHVAADQELLSGFGVKEQLINVL